MKMYKITTLGESFIFCLDNSEGAVLEHVEGEKNIIILKPSIMYDYTISSVDLARIYMPDLHRALMAYIYKIRAYPSSEYEIAIESKGAKITLPDYSGKIGGNVGKCKLLFSNYGENGDIFYMVKSEKAKYLITKADNISCFDDKKFISHLYTDSEDLVDTSAFLIYYTIGDKIAFRYVGLPERKSEVSSSAFAALAYLLSLTDAEKTKNIVCDGCSANCEVKESGIFVFDESPKIYKLV